MCCVIKARQYICIFSHVETEPTLPVFNQFYMELCMYMYNLYMCNGFVAFLLVVYVDAPVK